MAYSHQSGVVLLDVIQKCVILNASLDDLYGGAIIGPLNDPLRDISIQPFATSSILRDHYQTTMGLNSDNNQSLAFANQQHQQQHNNADNATARHSELDAESNDNSSALDDGLHKSPPGVNEHQQQQQQTSSQVSRINNTLAVPTRNATQCNLNARTSTTTTTTQQTPEEKSKKEKTSKQQQQQKLQQQQLSDSVECAV